MPRDHWGGSGWTLSPASRPASGLRQQEAERKGRPCSVPKPNVACQQTAGPSPSSRLSSGGFSRFPGATRGAWRVLPARCPTGHSPSASSPWTLGCRPGGCRRAARPPSVAGCAQWSWFSGGSSWRSWPSLLSGRATQRHQSVGLCGGSASSQVPGQVPTGSGSSPSPLCTAWSPEFCQDPIQKSILIPPNPNASPGGPRWEQQDKTMKLVL